MAAAFPAPPAKFVGRETYISRFKARVGHFPLFVYEGIPGIGKTSLMLRLAKEAKSIGANKSIYLALSPGEAIGSILARVEARLKVRVGSSTERQGDPFGRLADLLDAQKAVLIIDDLHLIRREDLSALARVLKGRLGKFRIMGAADGDLELSAMDRMGLYSERVGQFAREDVVKYSASASLSPEHRQILEDDKQRNGSVCQPYTLRMLLQLRANDFPDEKTLKSLSARSVNAFRQLLSEAVLAQSEDVLKVLRQLARVGVPIETEVASRALGKQVETLIEQGFADQIDGDVYVHSLVTHIVGTQVEIPKAAAATIAKHLETRGIANSEPVSVIRAGEILAHAGSIEEAVETLSSGWEAVRDFGFYEAYLKTLASIDSSGQMKSRVHLLAVRARMRKGNPLSVRDDLARLSKDKDPWTRTRALTALTYAHSQAAEHLEVVKAFEALQQDTDETKLLVPAGTLAAKSMVKLAKIADAEKLAQSLLKAIKAKKEPELEAELRRLLARVYAQAGKLKEAVEEAKAAAKCFEGTGDLYHASTAYGFIGDLHREAGAFEEAKKAFVKFRDLAETWGDRNLVQIAELADAWVSLDIGDLPHAAKLVDHVEKEMSAAPSRRLRRYLAAARALLDAGRGLHEEAAASLPRVVESWEQAGQRAIADVLRAQLVRSLIAIGQLDEADVIVKKTLSRLDSKNAAPRVASFLRESALIKLRRKQSKKAMEELSQARKLFAQGGNRREEALTLHRIAHAALEEGDTSLAETSAKEALSLAKKIKHARAVALAREVLGRVALRNDKTDEALVAIKESLQALRKLGDDIGTLHVSESMLRAQIVAGDLSGAIRLGPRVREHAERLSVREIRIRAIVLTGVALLRRGRVDQAAKCFKEIPEGALSGYTEALMWRLGEALAAFKGERQVAFQRRQRWVKAIKRLPESKQGAPLQALEQLALPPRDRARLKAKGVNEVITGERIAALELSDYDFVVDLQDNRVFVKGEPVVATDKGHLKLLKSLVLNNPRQVAFADAVKLATGTVDDKPEKKIKGVVRDFTKSFGKGSVVKVTVGAKGIKLTLPKSYAFIIPTSMDADLNAKQKRMMKLLARMGAAPVQTIQDEFELTRAAARRELGVLIDAGLVEAIRDGRGQAFRLQ